MNRMVYVLALLLALTFPDPLVAQRASQYIPLEHWSTPHIEHLIRSGIIADPAPLTRPLHRAAVLRELSEADTTGLCEATRTTIASL